MRRLSGLLADRPSPRTAVGARYYATDEQQVYVNYGSEWLAKTALDPADVAAFISGPNLAARPMVPGNYLGYLWTDAETGNQYEAFPDAWALVGNLTPSDGGGAFDISALPDASSVEDADLIPIDQSGTQKKAAKSLLGGGGVVDGQQIFDGSHVLAFDAGARKLYASDGTTMAMDWSAPFILSFFDGFCKINGDTDTLQLAGDITNADNDTVFALGSRTIFDDDNQPILTGYQRQLNATDGSIVADWSDPTLPTFSRFGNPAHDALQVLRANSANDGFEFADPAGGGGVVDGQQIFDDSHLLAFDAGVRKLYGNWDPAGWGYSDSTAIDWSGNPDNGVRFFGGYGVVNGVTIRGGRIEADSSIVAGGDGFVGSGASLTDLPAAVIPDGAEIFDVDHVLAGNFSNKIFYEDDGATGAFRWGNSLSGIGVPAIRDFFNENLIFDVANRKLIGRTMGKGAADFTVLDWSLARLIASDHLSAASADFEGRWLYSTDGTTVSLDWSQKRLKRADGTATLDWENSRLEVSGDVAMNWSDRQLIGDSGGSVVMDWAGGIKMPGLPTSDPGVTNQLWNDAGTVKISA